MLWKRIVPPRAPWRGEERIEALNICVDFEEEENLLEGNTIPDSMSAPTQEVVPSTFSMCVPKANIVGTAKKRSAPRIVLNICCEVLVRV